MKTEKPANKRGFALVVTLILMILLALLAVGMLSLSSITLRSSSRTSALAIARSNARLALILAIGELQKNTGVDTRITAPANISETSAPPLTGVWKSWQGTDHDSTGRPIRPDYDVKKTSSSGNSSDIHDGRFLTWLVSGAQAGAEPLAAGFKPSQLVSSGKTAGKVPLLSVGSLGTSGGHEVWVTPQAVLDAKALKTGSYAWWVSPENQKARLLPPYKPNTDTAVGWSDMQKSHAVADPATFGLDALLADKENYLPDPKTPKAASKAVSLQTTALLVDGNPSAPQHSFHDLSTTAVGLLTNTATGGWRKDMSLLTEKWVENAPNDIYSKFPGGKLPLFRYSPKNGDTSLVPKPTVTSYDASQSNFYPWSGYVQLGAKKVPMTYSAASASWQSLVNFATSYKSLNFNNSSKMAETAIGWTNIISSNSNQNFYNTYHTQEFNPIIARIQLIVQVNAMPDPLYQKSDPGRAAKNYRLNLRIVPIYTLWNPYNLKLSKTVGSPYRPGKDPDLGIGTLASLPLVLAIINGTVPPATGFQGNYKLMNGGNNAGIDGIVGWDYQLPKNVDKGYNKAHFPIGGYRSFTGYLPLEFTLKPGEVKVFSPSFNAFQPYDQGIRLKEGYATGDDFGMPIVNPNDPSDPNALVSKENRLIRVPGRPGNELYATDLVRFAVKADRHTKNYTDAISSKSGAGTFFTIGTTFPGWAISKAQIDAGQTDKGPHADYLRGVMAISVDDAWAQKYWPSDSLEEAQYNVSALVPGGGNPPWTNLYSVSFGPRLTVGDGSGNPQNRPTKGVLQGSPFVNNTYSIPEQKPTFHPANVAFDFAYHSMSINDDLTPEVGMKGYMATGYQSGNGLSRLIMSEIPLKPIASLVELQSWNLRGNNPVPPYQCNLIGNSDATPMIPKDGILMNDPVASEESKNLQHDDAYCANHLLFDDWFFSSIAPEPQDFGKTIAKKIDTVYREYLKGERRLLNRAYQPIAEDQALTDSLAATRISEIINSPKGDGWLKVASRFEVKGMFNVNSTSVKAWRALLGHARRQNVAYYSANGIAIDSNENEHVVSRHNVAADVKAGSDTGVGAAFPSGSEYSGFRTLSDAQLDELAEKIVEQVRVRGPFLSLSEFVNRQLSENKDLALAGAIQTALAHLSQDPNAALEDASDKQLASKTMDPSDSKLSGVGYEFAEAAAGYNTFGLPGWIRQADILRPIAPILSARDDTFTIRAYGDCRDAKGNVVATAWCEATMQRERDFVDAEDAADSIEPPTNDQNKLFGRRYETISFRWLNSDEV